MCSQVGSMVAIALVLEALSFLDAAAIAASWFRRLRWGLVMCATAAALTPSGAAGAPFTIAQTYNELGGYATGVAVDPGGTAYVAFYPTGAAQIPTPPAPAEPVGEVCTLPSGATSCAHLAPLTEPCPAFLPDDATNQCIPYDTTTFVIGSQLNVFINAAGDPVVVVTTRNPSSVPIGGRASQIVYTSTNGGASFSSSYQPIADFAPDTVAFDPWLSGGVVFSGALNPTNRSNGFFDSSELDLDATGVDAAADERPTAYAPIAIPTSNLVGVATAVSDVASGISLVAAWSQQLQPPVIGGAEGFAYYAGPPLKGLPAAIAVADMQEAKNWRIGNLHVANRVAGELQQPGFGVDALTGGPAGIYLLQASRDNPALGYDLVTRRWTGTTFGAAMPADCGQQPTDVVGDMFEDPATGDRQVVYFRPRRLQLAGLAPNEPVRVMYTDIDRRGGTQPIVLADYSHGIGYFPGREGWAEQSPLVASYGAHPGLAIWFTGPTRAFGRGTLHASWLPVGGLACKGPPTLQGVLTPAGSRFAWKLSLTIKAGTRALRGVTLRTPGGITLSTRLADLAKGLALAGPSGSNVGHVASTTGSTLEVTASSGQTGLTLTIAGPLLVVSRTLEREAEQHRRIGLHFVIRLTDVAGTVTRGDILSFVNGRTGS